MGAADATCRSKKWKFLLRAGERVTCGDPCVKVNIEVNIYIVIDHNREGSSSTRRVVGCPRRVIVLDLIGGSVLLEIVRVRGWRDGSGGPALGHLESRKGDLVDTLPKYLHISDYA